MSRDEPIASNFGTRNGMPFLKVAGHTSTEVVVVASPQEMHIIITKGMTWSMLKQ